MNIFKLNICENFECIGSSCPRTCCERWKITVDNKSAEYYKSVDGEFGDKLKEYVIPDGDSYMFKMLPDGRCPFLTEENLCEIYQKLGKDKMCFTCTRFPRLMFSINPDTCFETYQLSCYEVVRQFISGKDKIEIIESETGGENNVPEFYRIWFENMITPLKVSIELLQIRRISISERLRITLFFNDMLEKHLKNKENTTELINIFSDEQQCINMANLLSSMSEPKPAEYNRFISLVLDIFRDSSFTSGQAILRLIAPYIDRINSDGKRLDIASLLIHVRNEKYSLMLERYMVNEFFIYYMETDYEYNIMDCIRWTVYLYGIHVAIFAILTEMYGVELSQEITDYIFNHIARTMERNNELKKRIMNMTKESGISETSSLLNIII